MTHCGATRAHGLLALALALALSVSSCGSLRPRSPVVPAATEALSAARAAHHAADPAAARSHAERAAERAPDWVAPQRFLDELDRDALLAPSALARRSDAASRPGATGGELYLAARLERQDASGFQRAVERDRREAWAHHGVAWERSARGSHEAAARSEARAVALARDPWERSFFSRSQAQFLAAADDWEAAAKVLRKCIDDEALDPLERALVRSQLARLLMGQEDELARVEQGYLQAGVLLEAPELSGDDLRRLAAAMLEAPAGKSEDARAIEVEAHLAARTDTAGEATRAALLARVGKPALALALARRALASNEGVAESARSLRTLGFEAGEERAAMRTWLDDLPARVLAQDGRPKDEGLRRLADCLLGGTDPDPSEVSRRLMDVGWFTEALAVADRLALHDLDAALVVRWYTTAALSFLDHVDQVVGRAISAEPYGGLTDGGKPRAVDDLDGLLEALEPLATALDSHPTHTEGSGVEQTPRVSFGIFGEILHPGPTFDAVDQRQGRGTDGEVVPGLAALFDRLGRFALLGASPAGMDGVVLPVLLTERARGEHLGMPWSGTLVWAEGRDVGGRADRAGAGVTGAALHEGYWIDVEGVRRERDEWRRLQREWITDERAADVQRALAVTGRRLSTGEGAWKWVNPLGEAERVRLAVLSERAGPAPSSEDATGDLVHLDEVLAATAIHEQGHLCDRARFLPLSANLLEALGFIASVGFSPARALVRLEYRAQLVALCEVDDPRVVLSDCLAMAERGRGAHATAYRDLLEDFLVELARRVRTGEIDLDDERLLIHQLHALRPDAVRAIALALADDEGLVEAGDDETAE